MQPDPDPQDPHVEISGSDAELLLVLTGNARVGDVEALRRDLSSGLQAQQVTVDIAGLLALDTAGAWAIADLEAHVLGAGGQFALIGATPAQDALIAAVRENMAAEDVAPEPRADPLDRIAALGQGTWEVMKSILLALSFLGEVIAGIGRVILHPSRLRVTSLVNHMETTGWQAIPIVAVMAFLIGVVLAFQGAVQLSQFGAEIFVVELISISILRELGILLTAIIVAGRTGAAFTAAIGSMKMREEIDAMRTLGLDPIEVLVVPRVLAMIIVLPLLGVIANLAGIFGGALMSWIELGVSPGMFRARLASAVAPWNYGVGMIKAPFFALIIAVVGCYQGMQVGGNAESLGRLTSKSVVVAIFTVILVDALFSVFFSIMGV
jgi:phospholipid/cholesterol/gamma-HCH transport system permease protein